MPLKANLGSVCGDWQPLIPPGTSGDIIRTAQPYLGFRMARHLLATFLCLSALVPSSRAQSAGVIPVYLMMNGGAGGADAAFQAVEFAQQKLQQDNRKAAEAEAERAKLVGAGSVSALDLQAPPKALDEYDKAIGINAEAESERSGCPSAKGDRPLPEVCHRPQCARHRIPGVATTANPRPSFWSLRRKPSCLCA